MEARSSGSGRAQEIASGRGAGRERAASSAFLRGAAIPSRFTKRGVRSFVDRTAFTPGIFPGSRRSRNAPVVRRRADSEWLRMWWMSSSRKSGRIGTATAPYERIAR